MNKKKVLIVGFGAMGCRHTQAFLSQKSKFEVHVLEPSENNIKENLKKINAEYNDCKWYSISDDIPVLDIAVIATSSKPRFEIIKKLLKIGYRNFLLEKIVFQSEYQFKTVLKLTKKFNALVYCNFVNRYFDVYNIIRKEILTSNNKTHITVHGGEFGLGCNSIHYIDIFQYLTNCNNPKLVKAKINISKIKNKRGNEYEEFTGFITLKNNKSDSVRIISEVGYNGGVTINIRSGGKNYFINEQTKMFYYHTKKQFNFERFSILPTSSLSNVIVDDIFNNNCVLTKLEETYLAHIELFNVFNKTLYGKTFLKKLCPIT